MLDRKLATLAADRPALLVKYVATIAGPPGPEHDAWVRRHLPRGVALDDAVLLLAPDAERRNRAYTNTLRAIADARLPRRAAMRLAASLIRQGDKARAWRDAGFPDPYAERRRADAEAVKERETARNAALRLAQHFAGGPGPNDAPLIRTLLQVRDQGVSIVAPTDETASVPINTSLANFLRLYAANLDASSATANGAAPVWLHNSTAPPFLFSRTVRKTPPKREALIRGLLWCSTFKARMVTGAAGQNAIGAPMPNDGDPLWNVAAALVEDVTGEPCNPEHAQDALATFIRRNPGVGFFEWPLPNHDT